MCLANPIFPIWPNDNESPSIENPRTWFESTVVNNVVLETKDDFLKSLKPWDWFNWYWYNC